MAALLQLLMRAAAWVGAGYIANDVVDIYMQPDEADQTSKGQQFQNALAKFQERRFLIKAGILAAGVAAVTIATMSASKRKRTLKI